MGSTAEKKPGKNLSPYEYAKKVARKRTEESKLCDFYFVTQYVKGRGEQKMKLAVPILWNKLKYSKRCLFGFKVSMIDVDDLADIMYYLLEIIQISPQKLNLIEVNVANGELLFGEIIKNLLPKEKRIISKAIIPSWLEGLFLWLYFVIIPIVKPNDQFARRLANFAKRSLTNHKEPNEAKIFKTAEDIKKLALDTDNYKIIESTPNLIISDRHQPVIYVLREKSKEELEQIVQKALISPD